MTSPRSGLINRAIASIVNGVSQQPPTLRLPSQAEEQINMLSSVSDGVSVRPPFEHIKRILTSIASAGYKVHIIDRDATERYIVLVGDQVIKVFDFAGTEKTVATPDGVAYLDVTDPEDEFALTSIADYTFISNRSASPAMSGTKSPSRPNEFLFYVKNAEDDGASGREVTLYLDGVGEKPSLPSTDDTSLTRDNMWNALTGSAAGEGPAAGVDNSGGSGADWTNWEFTRVNENVLYGEQVSDTGNPQEVTSGDERADTLHTLAYKSLQKFSDLPLRGYDGFTVEITGDPTSTFDNYWVTYDGEQQVWRETVAPDIDIELDASTMPHILVKESDGTFTFSEADWADREKGDEDSAPLPSFIGKSISDILLHANRLTFIADENAILSETSEFFNFFATTATALLDSDPIDTAGSTRRVAIWDFLVPYQGTLMLWSGQGGVQSQFGRVGEILTPATLPPTARSFYKVSRLVRPLPLGPYVYFVVDRDASSGVMEYRIKNEVDADADEVTAHVNTYLPGNIRQMVAAEGESTIVLFSPDEPYHLYVYRYFLDRDQKLMASWSRWDLAEDDVIYAMDFVDSELVILVERADGLHLEKLDLRKLQDVGLNDPDTGRPYRCYLDSLVESTGSYSMATGKTTWTLPYEVESTGTYELVLGSAFGSQMGRTITEAIFTPASTTVTADGDWSAGPVAIGRRFPWRYQMSEVVLDESGARSTISTPITQGRLQIKRVAALFKNSGNFKVNVAFKQDTESYDYLYTGKIMGSMPLGSPRLTDGRFEFDVGGRSTDVIVTFQDDGHLPVTFTSLEWEAFYYARATRI